MADLDLETSPYDAPADPPPAIDEEEEDLSTPEASPKATMEVDQEFKNAMDKAAEADLAAEPQATPGMDSASLSQQALTPQAAPAAQAMGMPGAQQAMGAPPASQARMIDQVINPTAEQMNQQNLSWAQDLANRHIQPKTYKDLFNDTSLPGKIGLAFGVLLSGIGSGLTHQPNAALEMMNKMIDKDFEAQKLSKENANNYLRTEYDHQMQLAQQNLVNAQASGIPISNKEIMARIKDIESDVYLKSQTAALNHAKISMIQNLQDTINNLPPGQQAPAQNLLDTVIVPKWTQEIQDANLKTAAQLNARSMLRDSKPTQASEEDKFTADQTRLRLLGMNDIAADKESRHYPGLGEASVPLSGDDRRKINTSIGFQNQLQGFINWSRAHSGALNPADLNYGKALAAELQSAYRAEIEGGVYKEGEQDFISKIITDDPAKFFNELRSVPQLRAVQHESDAKFKEFLRSKGFKKAPTYRPTWEQGKKTEKPRASAIPPDGTKGVANGIPFTWKNGKRVKD